MVNKVKPPGGIGGDGRSGYQPLERLAGKGDP
jgi:hypothetical protein